MKKILLYLFLLLIITTFQEKTQETKTSKIELDSSNDYEMTEEEKQEKIQNLANAYIQEQKWIQEKEIDKEEFKKMFNYIIQRSALKQENPEILKKFADKAVKNFGETIIVKNLKHCFELRKLRKIYLQIFNAKISTDL